MVVKPVPLGAPVPPLSVAPQEMIEPSAFSTAKEPPVEKTWVKPVPVGPLVSNVPVAPHETRELSLFIAAKPLAEDQTSTKPLPVGPLVPPPLLLLPHTAMLPSTLSAA